jgi:hypothetical protein
MNELKMIAGIGIGFLISVFLLSLFAGRKMLVVHGTRRQKQIGFYRALCSLIRMYYGGYSNTLFVNPNCVVKARQGERELTKNERSKRPGQTAKSMMIFEVEL